MSPDDFERWVADFMQSLGAGTPGFTVTLHERIAAGDGTYEIDVTARYEVAGVAHLMLIEAKRHTNPIKRELVQALHQKLQSVGGHKAVLVATAPFQSGAIDFALAHGIALIAVTQGRFAIMTKSFEPTPPPSRRLAYERFGIPTFIGIAIYPGESPGSISFGTLALQDVEGTARRVFG